MGVKPWPDNDRHSTRVELLADDVCGCDQCACEPEPLTVPPVDWREFWATEPGDNYLGEHDFRL